MIGSVEDRSTLGRFQIWRVCLSVIRVHPWLGSGLSSYQAAQTAQMTPALASFNPLNGEAKSLYLNFTAEFGCIGLMFLFHVVRRYGQTIRITLPALQSAPEIGAVLIGTTAGLVAIAVAGLTDTPILQADRAPSTFALALLIGAIAGIVRDTLPKPKAEPLVIGQGVRRAGWIAILTVFVLIVWTALSSFLLIHRAMPRMDHYVFKLTNASPSATASTLPSLFQDVLIATEDRNFHQHNGVDWEAIHYALRKDMRFEGVPEGASTISMQTVRYILLPYDKTPVRKVAQIVLAYRIERRLKKADIMRLYCDSVGFGLHTAGLRNAARIYFAKKPNKLSLAECAFLVGAISHQPRSIQELTVSSVEQRKLAVLNHLEHMDEWAYDPQMLENARREQLHFAWEKAPILRKELR
jgi:hypothetical protein